MRLDKSYKYTRKELSSLIIKRDGVYTIDNQLKGLGFAVSALKRYNSRGGVTKLTRVRLHGSVVFLAANKKLMVDNLFYFINKNQDR